MNHFLSPLFVKSTTVLHSAACFVLLPAGWNSHSSFRHLASANEQALGQPQHDPEHQEGEEHALRGVEDDRHPRATEAVGGEGVQEAGKDRIRYTPGLVNVVKAKEYAVRHPTPASEHALHLGQQHPPKKKFLPQDRVERGLNNEQGEEPPGALQPRQDLLRSEDRVQAIALWLRKKREDRHPNVF